MQEVLNHENHLIFSSNKFYCITKGMITNMSHGYISIFKLCSLSVWSSVFAISNFTHVMYVMWGWPLVCNCFKVMDLSWTGIYRPWNLARFNSEIFENQERKKHLFRLQILATCSEWKSPQHLLLLSISEMNLIIILFTLEILILESRQKSHSGENLGLSQNWMKLCVGTVVYNWNCMVIILLLQTWYIDALYYLHNNCP